MNSPSQPDGGLEALPRPSSLAEQAYVALRERIAIGTLLPGQRLTERGLALLLGVSPTPVREAIRRLEQEGLLTRSTPRSLTVVAHSEEALRELLHTEIVLRAALARFATTKISDGDIARMDAIVDELLVRATKASASDLLAAAADFDAILQTAADSPAVAALVASAGVFSQARRIASVETMRSKLPEVGKHHLLAHREIVQALRTRDPDLVEQAVRAQLRAAYDLLLSDLDAPSASRR